MKRVVCDLRAVMERKGIKSVSELQKITGLPRRTLDKCFHDEARQLSYNTAVTICVALGCDLRDLYRLVDDEEYREIQRGKQHHKDRLRNGVVYFIKNPSTGLVKIGKTIDVVKRLDQLSKEFKTKLELIGTIESDDSIRLEKEIHTLFTSKRVEGEWFNITGCDLEMIKEEVEC